MDRFEEWTNWLNDLDSEWWPFQFLRPETHEKLTTQRVMLLAVLYGVFAGLFGNAIAALGGKAGALNPFLLPLSATLGFFIVFRVTFAFCWNRRAERLSAERMAPFASARVRSVEDE